MQDIATNIRQLPPAEYWIVWTLLAAGALAALIYAFRQWRRARLIEDVPTAKIRSAPQGYVELEGVGKMMPGEPIVSPLTKKHCLWFYYKIEKRERVHFKGGSQTRWRTVEQGESDDLFLIDDGTGVCVVDPEGAEVTPLDRLVWYGDTPRPMTVPLLEGGGTGFGGLYRYTETFIMAGQPLYVIGTFKTVAAVEGYSSAEIARDLIRSWKQNQPLLLKHFDANRDGRIDPREWQKVRQVAQRKAEQEYRKRASQPDTHLIGRPPDSDYPFLLSAHPQERLSRRYRRRATISLGLFFLLGVVTVWIFSVRWGGSASSVISG